VLITQRVSLGALTPLEYARRSRGLTQRELEGLVGFPPTTISHLEARRRKPDPATQFRLAEVLGVPVEALFPW
jgi:transcriptional regulator with XRE-family HTH domain